TPARAPRAELAAGARVLVVGRRCEARFGAARRHLPTLAAGSLASSDTRSTAGSFRAIRWPARARLPDAVHDERANRRVQPRGATPARAQPRADRGRAARARPRCGRSTRAAATEGRRRRLEWARARFARIVSGVARSHLLSSAA